VSPGNAYVPAVESEEDTQWTAETRRRFAVEVEALVDAVRRHGAEVLALTGRQAALPVIFRVGADLARAVRSQVPGLEEVESSTRYLDAADEAGRREALRSALGSVEDGGHQWDGDPAAWVREQRSGEG
jgi:hypothetical protein